MNSAKRMRVLFAIGSMGGGGAERQALDLITHLDRGRFAPELYLAYRAGELLAEVPSDVPMHAYVDGPAEVTVGQRLAGKLRMLPLARSRHLARLLRREKYDLVFSLGLALSYEAACAARGLRIPRIAYCLLDPVAELDLDFPHRTPWRWQAARWTYSGASRVFANSIDLCRRLEKFYRLPISSVELFLNLRNFSRLDQLAAAEGPQWPCTGTRLVCVGRLERQKGHALLLESLAELVHRRGRDVQLAIVGQGSLESELKRQAVRLGLEKRVLWAGFQQNPVPYFRDADIFVLPSLWEGLPNVLIEALALGVPSVASDCPTGPREILEDGRWGTLVPAGDVAALAAALERVMDHLPEERTCASAAQTAIRAKYDVAAGVRQLEQRLLDIVHASRQRMEPR